MLPLLAVAVLLSWGLWQRGDRIAARADLAVAEQALITSTAQIDQMRLARAVLDGHLKRTEAERDKWAALARTYDQLEGRNDPLNPYLRAVLDGVRAP